MFLLHFLPGHPVISLLPPSQAPELPALLEAQSSANNSIKEDGFGEPSLEAETPRKSLLSPPYLNWTSLSAQVLLTDGWSWHSCDWPPSLVLSWTCHWFRIFYSQFLVSDKILEWQHPPWLPTHPSLCFRFLQASHLLPSLSLMAQFWGSHIVIYCDLWWEIHIWSSSCFGHKTPKIMGISYVIKK